MPKRDYGSGGIRQKVTGRWEASLRTGGRRITRNFATRRGAQGWLNKANQEAQQGTLVVPERITVAEYLARWLAAIAASIRPKTLQEYTSVVQTHLIPAFGTRLLSQLQPLAIQELWQRKIEAGLSPGTVRYIHAVLRRALKMAVRWGLLARNPMDSVEPPRARPAAFAVWTEDEARAFLSGIRTHRLFALYLLALATGMRKGELLGLRWEDVDWQGGRLAVRRQVGVVGGRITVGEPKTAKSRRSVALPDVALSALAEHRERGGDGSGYVFVSETGEAMWPEVLSRQFLALAYKMGLPRIRFHDLRHTAATLMLSRGVHPKIVSEMLGHSGVGMTLDVYSHVLPHMQREAAREMQSLLA